MNHVDKRITDFIKRHHVLTLATCGQHGPYCANIFYSYIPGENLFVFTSALNTCHGDEMEQGGRVGASIVLETRVGKLQGLQMTGHAELAGGEILRRVRKSYLKRFPFAVAAELTLWTLRPAFMKFTDNRLGFGKKLIWNG